jgi:hypothetical protein
MDLEKKGTNTAVLDERYLKLDQTTPQEVENGAPKFQAGVTIKNGQKLILDGI